MKFKQLKFTYKGGTPLSNHNFIEKLLDGYNIDLGNKVQQNFLRKLLIKQSDENCTGFYIRDTAESIHYYTYYRVFPFKRKHYIVEKHREDGPAFFVPDLYISGPYTSLMYRKWYLRGKEFAIVRSNLLS